MRASNLLSSSFVVLFLALPAFPQQAPTRDPQAVAVLQQSLTVMGSTVPADSVATGTVKIIAGSKTDMGTIRILTRGLDQTLEEIQSPAALHSEVYSAGAAGVKKGEQVEEKSLEWAATAQSPASPLALIAAALGDPDSAFEYVGLEKETGQALHHIRFWKTYSAHPKLHHLAEFSVRDLWIDVATGLPVRLSFERREAGGAADRFRVDVFYSDYRNVGSVIVPFRIAKSLNGTPWVTVQVEKVLLNTGLSDADFSIQ